MEESGAGACGVEPGGACAPAAPKRIARPTGAEAGIAPEKSPLCGRDHHHRRRRRRRVTCCPRTGRCCWFHRSNLLSVSCSTVGVEITMTGAGGFVQLPSHWARAE